MAFRLVSAKPLSNPMQPCRDAFQISEWYDYNKYNLAASRFHEIWREDVLPLNIGPEYGVKSRVDGNTYQVLTLRLILNASFVSPGVAGVSYYPWLA